MLTLNEGEPRSARAEPLARLEVSLPPEDPAPPAAVDARKVLRELRTLSGDPAGMKLGDAPVVAVFFKTNCYTCRGELLRAPDLERRAAQAGARLLWVSLDSDAAQVEEAFRQNRITARPLCPGEPIPGMAVPTVYLVQPDRVEQFVGRFAVEAALLMIKPSD